MFVASRRIDIEWFDIVITVFLPSKIPTVNNSGIGKADLANRGIF